MKNNIGYLTLDVLDQFEEDELINMTEFDDEPDFEEDDIDE